jgi:RNA-binding motif protein, X-linked 2
MREYIIAQRKEARAAKKSKKSKSKRKHKDETPEERRVRKERRKDKKDRKLQEKSEGVKNVEQLLKSLDRRREGSGYRSVSPRRDDNYSRGENGSPDSHQLRSGRGSVRSRTPPRRY